MRTLSLPTLLAGAVLTLGGCRGETAMAPISAPLVCTTVSNLTAPKTARFPYLAIAGERILLSWIEPVGAAAHRLRFTSSIDALEFSPARTIAEGEDWFVNWADFPSIAGDTQGNYAAHWLQKNGSGKYSYGVRVACSSNHGDSWTVPFWLHDDQSAAEHGFATLVAEGQGRFTAVWLDGCDQQATGNMTLHSVRFDHTGKKLGNETLLDPRVCDCCATDATWLQTSGLVTVFRDRSEPGFDAAEIRDIATIRQRGDDWSAATTCHDDLWHNPG